MMLTTASETQWTTIVEQARQLDGAARGDSLAVEMLLKAGADPNGPRESKWQRASTLARAVKAGSAPAARLLLDAGAVENSGEDLADILIKGGQPANAEHGAVLELLIERGRATTQALGRATLVGAAHWCRQLTAGGAAVDSDANRWETAPLRLAIGAHGSTQDAAATAGAEPSGVSERHKGTETVRELLRMRANPKSDVGRRGGYRRPPLVAAVELGAAWAITPLIESGASPQAALNAVRLGRHGPLPRAAAMIVELLRHAHKEIGGTP